MTLRVLAAATLGGTDLVYDPATGLTHAAPRPLTPGRHWLDAREVASWPVVLQRQIPTVVPFTICWSPIVRCNLACPQCLDDKGVAELQARERMRLASVLASSGTLGVDISGGEPLLLKDLTDLARELTSAGSAVSCTTNGWHLQRHAQEMAQVFDAVRVSLDGHDAASHDRWRGKHSFARACAGIRAAVGAGLPVQLHYVVMRSTVAGAQAVAELAAELGACGVTFLQMLPIGAGAQLADAEMLTDAEASEHVAAIRPPEGVRVRLRTRTVADGFTVVRADGKVWRNHHGAQRISPLRPLLTASDLLLPTPEGSPA